MNSLVSEVKANMVITKLLLIETADNYRDIPQRGYSLNASIGTIHRLDSILSPGYPGVQRQVSSNELATCVPDLISFNSKPIGIAEIPYGWAVPRLRFLMEYCYDTGGGTLYITYLQGFTEYHDPSMTGLLDPRMRFHINSVVNVTRTMVPDQNNNYIPHSRVSSMYNIISDIMGRTQFQEVQTPDIINTIKLCRPTDIASNLFAMELTRQNEDGSVGYTIMNNMTDTITNYKPASSNRGNNDPFKYMATTLNAFTSTKNASEIGYNNTDIFSATVNVTREPDLSKCLFMDRLLEIRNYAPESPSSFTLEELDIVSPGTTEFKTTLVARQSNGYNVSNIAEQHNILGSDDTADLLQPTPEAIKSGIISSAISSIMLENLVTRLGFSSTNRTGQPEVILTDINSFMDGIDPMCFVERIKTSILTNIIPNVSDCNLSTYDLFVSADLLGDITIGLQLNSNPTAVMRYPAFADSLYAPVVSRAGANQILINEFQTLIDNTILAKF